jgi:hypothetical protein
MFCFSAIGYASLSATLDVEGSTEIDIPSGLFIIGITVKGQSNMDVNEYSFVPFSTTVSNSLSKTKSNETGSVTYEITVLNNTDREYAFRGLYYQSQASGYNNNLVTESTWNANSKITVSTSFPYGKIVAAGATLKFNVTYTLGSSLNKDTTYKTLINYQFGINVESEAEAVDAVHEKFLDILNTTSTYNTLIDVLDNKYDGTQAWTSNYVGNVGDATSDDAMAVNTLFAGQLQLVINGQTKPATVIIKHENLDGNTNTGDDYVAINPNKGNPCYGYGCEMTLYLTTDPLSTSNGNAPVYVTVFTCDRDANGNIVSDWYVIGETYKGKAPIVSYNGTAGGTGSFVTDNWVADAASYQVTENYTYTVSQGTNIKTLVQTVDARMTAEFQTLLISVKEMIEDATYAGSGIAILEEAYESASAYYTVDANGNPVAKNGVTRAQLCPIVKNLEHNLQVAKDKIDEIQGLN